MGIILNADDFGYSDDTVDATIECFEAGLLTSATVMVGMPATERALEFARAHPQFSFGVHLQLTGDGTERALSPRASVPGLVDADGHLLPTNEVRRRALLRRISPQEVATETRAQVGFVRDRGVDVTHVDSHRHLHKFPRIRAGLELALPELEIDRVRNVQDVFLKRPSRNPTALFGPSWRRSLMKHFATTRHFYMPTTTSDVSWEELAAHLPDGSLEVGLHPGREEEWRRAERESLSAFVERLGNAHRLVSWREITFDRP